MAKKQKRKVSPHGKSRMRERVNNTNSRRLGTEAYYAWKRGEKPSEISGPFRRWLDGKSIYHRSTPRVYQGNVYWFMKGGRVLKTVYPIPERFLIDESS